MGKAQPLQALWDSDNEAEDVAENEAFGATGNDLEGETRPAQQDHYVTLQAELGGTIA